MQTRPAQRWVRALSIGVLSIGGAACKAGGGVEAAGDAAERPFDAARDADEDRARSRETGAPAAEAGASTAGAGVDGGAASDAAAPDAALTPADSGSTRDSTVGTSALSSLFSAQAFAQLFLHQAESSCNAQLYTHAALLQAAAAFPSFASEGSEQVRRRELAAFLANISHETTGGWATAPDGPAAWGLCFREEVGCDKGACTGYCDASNTKYPCAQGQTYHGRGPMQLSWNYNYGQVGAALGIDLLHDPASVTKDGAVGWKTALWFWMTPQSPKPSAHAVMTGGWQPTAQDIQAGRRPGFGMTVNIINGGLECGIANDKRVEDRVAFFQRYAGALGVSVGDNLRCDTMKSY